MDCSLPGFPVLHYLLDLLRLVSTELVKPFKHFILFCSRLFLPSTFPSIRVFSNDFLMIDWFDLLAVQVSRVFSKTTVEKHQFFSTQPSLWSNSHIHT